MANQIGQKEGSIFPLLTWPKLVSGALLQDWPHIRPVTAVPSVHVQSLPQLL